MSTRYLEPYTQVVIDTTSDQNQEVVLDLGCAPIRLSVQATWDDTVLVTLYGSNVEDDGFVSLTTANTSPALIQITSPDYRFLKIKLAPTGSNVMQAIVHTKI